MPLEIHKCWGNERWLQEAQRAKSMLKKERIQKRVGKSRQAWSGGFGHRAGRSHSGRARQSDRSNPMSCVVDPPWIEVRRLGNWLSPKGQASRSSPMPLCQGKPLYQGKHEHTKSPNSRHSLRVSISHLVVFSRVPTATWCALRSQSGPATLSVVCESVAIQSSTQCTSSNFERQVAAVAATLVHL